VLCDQCGEREASLYVRLMLDSSAVELNLCERCARERAASGLCFDLVVGELSQESADNSPLLFDPARYASVCPRCGLTAEELARGKLLGCADCYDAHAEALGVVLRLVQGVAPQGRRPQLAEVGARLAKLQAELNEAIAREEYGRAAALRDQINELRQTGNA